MAIADAVIEIAGRQARGRRVTRVELRVGRMREIVPPALQFAFELASPGTAVEGADLDVDVVEASGICRICERETPLPGLPPACAHCGGDDIDVVRGQELVVGDIDYAIRARGPKKPV